MAMRCPIGEVAEKMLRLLIEMFTIATLFSEKTKRYTSSSACTIDATLAPSEPAAGPWKGEQLLLFSVPTAINTIRAPGKTPTTPYPLSCAPIMPATCVACA